MIKLQINEKNLIKNLGNSFTNKSNLFTELAQNSRRSGASFVKINLDKDKKTMIVEDNGCGIADFQSLMTVAGSGWDKEVSDIENPFGMGFLSAIYLSSKIEVESNGKLLVANQTDILQGKEISLKSVEKTIGTKITLHGVNESVFSVSYHALFDGFPIPVYIDDKQEDRNESFDFLNTHEDYLHVSFWFGDLFLYNENYLVKDLFFSCYFQGLKINTNYSYRITNNNNVIHLNENSFKVRMPDRDCLIDQKSEIEKIRETITEWQKNEIKKNKESFKWLSEHYRELSSHLLLSLFNEFDTIPHQFLSSFDDVTIPCSENKAWDGNYMDEAKPIFTLDKEKHEIENIPIVDNGLFEFGIYQQDDDFALALYLAKKKAIVLTEAVPDNHWLKSMSIDLDKLRESFSVIINNKIESETNLDIYLSESSIALCDSFLMNGSFGEIKIEDIAVTAKIDNKKVTLVPSKYNDSDIIEQICIFQSEYEYDETLKFNFEKIFSNWLRIERSLGNPSKIVEDYLKKLVEDVPVLKGKKFNVKITKKGKITVNE